MKKKILKALLAALIVLVGLILFWVISILIIKFPLSVSNGNEKIKPTEVFLWSEGGGYCDDGYALFAGPLVTLEEEGKLDEVPQISYKKGIKVKLPLSSKINLVSVYSVDNISEAKYKGKSSSTFSNLEVGEWYVVYSVQTKNAFGNYGDAYVFKLIVDDGVTE